MRLTLAVILAKILRFLTQNLRLGGGSAAPGLYALKVEPSLIKKLSSQIDTNIVITGTNGKTTTSRILAHFIKSNRLKVLQNLTGSNLQRGVASALVTRADLSGKIKNVDIGIWELDEAAFNNVVFELRPKIIVFLNAFRDQLDRYGEVDAVVKKWHSSLDNVDWNPTVLVNSGDLNTWSLSDVTGLETQEFRVKNYVINQELGVKNPGRKHKDHFLAEVVKSSGLSGNRVRIDYPGGKSQVNFPIPGVYHVYDLLAAFGVYYNLNLEVKDIGEYLKSFSPAFGRVERVLIEGKESFIFLIKNPAGATAVFETLAPEIKSGDRLFMALNDNFADGTDVSWIWDAGFEELKMKGGEGNFVVSGTRAYDLALRLKYAGVKPESIEVIADIEAGFEKSKEGLLGRLFILPTYTALLELQEILTKKGYKKHYWREN